MPLSKVNNNQLIVEYIPEDQSAIYDVCDNSGKIYLSGKIRADHKTVINLELLKKGAYHLYIIDQGDVLKERILYQ